MQTHGQKIILANWKSNKTVDEAVQWITAVGTMSMNTPYTVIVSPPSVFLAPLHYVIDKGSFPFQLCIQDISQFPAGAYTGAISTRNIEGLGVKYALLGHSERRRYFHETVQEIANKVDLAVEVEITPIVCLREEDIVPQTASLSPEARKKVVVLYETVGHIGTGEVEDLNHVRQSVQKIHEAFEFDVPVIYGGSVSDKTRDQFLHEPLLAGIGVGTASLDIMEFAKIIK